MEITSLELLTGHGRDEVAVLVEVENHEASQLSARRNQQVVSRPGAVPDLKPRDGANTHQVPPDPLGPPLPIDSVAQTVSGAGARTVP